MEKYVRMAHILLARVFLGSSALAIGLYLLFSPQHALEALSQSHITGMPATLVWSMVVGIQLIGGVGILLGLLTRIVSYLLFWTIIPLKALLTLTEPTFLLWFYLLPMVAGYLLIIVLGAGSWSLDWLLSSERARSQKKA